jgi:hypothetical protein
MIGARVVVATFAVVWASFLFLPLWLFTYGGSGKREFAVMYVGLLGTGLLAGGLGCATGKALIRAAGAMSYRGVSVGAMVGLAVWPLLLFCVRLISTELELRVGVVAFWACGWLGAFAGGGVGVLPVDDGGPG